MIRFVTFTGDQGLSGLDPCFAFFDTITDRFISLTGYQVFDDAADLTDAWNSEDGFKPDLDRLLGFVENWTPVPSALALDDDDEITSPEERIAKTTGAAIDMIFG